MCVPLQVRTDEGFSTMFHNHSAQDPQLNFMQLLDGGPAPAPQLPRRGTAAEVNCGICRDQFDVPLRPAVDVNYVKTRQQRQLWCCEECARKKSCWGEVWGLGDHEGSDDGV